MLFTILKSQVTIVLEMVFVLLPTTGIAVLAPIGIALIATAPNFGFVLLLSVIGLFALWRLFFSLLRLNSAPEWVFFGLTTGVIAAAVAAFKFPSSILVYGPCVVLTIHWLWLHKQNAIKIDEQEVN
jgi:predicted Abi (CAAX) family protease